jgi:curved DNA-binding protein CbpA
VIPDLLLPYSPERDVYRLLQVSPNAGRDEILAACRRLALTFHPDRNPSPRATDAMQIVNAIRTMLTDPVARAEYDWWRVRWEAAERGRLTAMAVGWAARGQVPAGSRAPGGARYLRAALIATRATLGALLPARCAGCRMVVDDDDAWCAGCGSRLLLPATRTAG